MRDAHGVVTVHDLAGLKVGAVALPSLGSVGGFDGRRSDGETFYTFTGFLAPPTIYRLEVATLASTVFRAATVKFDPAGYEAEQVFYASKDGTKIPMFLVHRKGLPRDGRAPTLLYGYGGFDVSLTPAFSPGVLPWLELGGVYAVANLRGGGEYGKAWYDAGRLANKQNVFDDFTAAADWLVASGWTSVPRLAISGGSNGGLLVGACLTQHPEKFGAAVPEVGVLDMLRFHRFTGGFAWTSDYSDPDTAEGFAIVRAYSPLQNLRPGTHYPPTLVMTAEHDDRVVPAHSFKFTAALQAAQGGPAPVLARIERRAGHGAGKPTRKIIEARADALAFLVQVLGVGAPPPPAEASPLVK
jgi:prolyl oligopeptidase